jgi:phage terminase large subunit
LIESKIQKLGVGAHFQVLHDRIVTPGDGLIIFQGMQDSTAESIKSLEGFDIAWVEEAQTERAQSVIVTPHDPKGRIGTVGQLEPTPEEGRHR